MNQYCNIMTEVAGRSAWCDSAQSIIVLPVASYGTKIQEFEKPSFFVCCTCGAAVILTGLRTAWRTRFATRSACRKVDRPPAEMPVSTNLHEARGTRHRGWGWVLVLVLCGAPLRRAAGELNELRFLKEPCAVFIVSAWL